MMQLIFRYFGVRTVVCLFVLTKICLCDEILKCNLRPLGTKAQPLPPDNRFVIDIEDCGEKYIPGRNYTVRLHSQNGNYTFIAFTISISGDTKPNEKNPRIPIDLLPGTLVSSLKESATDTITKDICKNTLFQSNIRPKTSVEALWIAPVKGNGCVTIFAYVAIKPDVWYNSDGPLSKRVCEDTRNADDMQPKENDNCMECEEARYELVFEGTWSYNTHPQMFPDSRESAKFSDIIGATHSKDFYLYKFNTAADDGLTMLAEYGNTTKLEWTILEHLGGNVRTVVKASAPPKPNMSTVASFRANNQKHLLSLVTAIMPSPDWFLGVANLELCDYFTSRWAKSITYNMYPLDAGTDSGDTFEASNAKTTPPHPVSLAVIKKDSAKNAKPFAKLHINLVRTYTTPKCQEQTTEEESSNEDEETSYGREVPVEEPPTTTTSERPLLANFTIQDCDITNWDEWGVCEGDCVDNVRSGWQTRFRFYLKDGKVVTDDENVEISEECTKYYMADFTSCEEPCEEPTTEADTEEIEAAQRVLPGQNWGWSGRK